MTRRPLPPLRRIVQAVVVIGLWAALVLISIRRAGEGSWLAMLGLIALVLLLLWAIDALVPWLGSDAVVLGRPAPAGVAPRVALTFDDGPSTDTPAVLDALRREGIRATFFVLGRHAEKHPELVRALAEAGHVVGNHTYSHRVLAFASPREIASEIDRTQEILTGLTGQAPALFRAPRGFQGPLVRSALRRRKLQLIAWTRGAWDSERRAAEDIASLAAAHPRDGDILLLHDGAGTPGEQRRDRTAQAIPLIVGAYRDRGFQFVTVPEILDGETPHG